MSEIKQISTKDRAEAMEHVRTQTKIGTLEAGYLLDRFDATLTVYEARLRSALDLADRLRLEAQMWSGEAKTQTATVYEIYQVLSGATGEPGSWNGARPAKDAVSKLQATEAQLEKAMEALEFYADQNHWASIVPSFSANYRVISISDTQTLEGVLCGGERARVAIALIKGEA